MGTVPFVVVDTLHRLVDLGEALAVIGPHALRHEGKVFRVEKEIARQDVTCQQIHHLGLPIRGGRAGRRDVLQVEYDDPGGTKIETGWCVQGREATDQVGDVALEDLRRLLARLRQLQALEHVAHLVGSDRADQIFKDRHRMALRAFGQTELADIAELAHDVAPIRRLLVQRNAVLRDRAGSTSGSSPAR